ncbi:MAG: hypothetical protein JXR88_07345 [Clostridia bacterium]|nr:hypothetical protein [Clostridia bacterium]
MKSYYIGMHEFFDAEKLKRDWKPHFAGIECCNLENKEEWHKLLKVADERNLQIGVHYPLFKNADHERDPLLNTSDESTRHISLIAIEQLMGQLSHNPISYLLVHFPKPMILDEHLPWHHARFPEHHFKSSKDMSYGEFYALAYEIVSKLDILSSIYNIPILLELELINHYIYDSDILKSLLKTFKNVSLCVDTARMHIIEQIDENFDAVSFIKKHSEFISHIHLSNLCFVEGIKEHHYPALKRLNPIKGWGNLECMLKACRNNKAQSLLFEHDSSKVSVDELDSIYDWVDKVLK